MVLTCLQGQNFKNVTRVALHWPLQTEPSPPPQNPGYVTGIPYNINKGLNTKHCMILLFLLIMHQHVRPNYKATTIDWHAQRKPLPVKPQSIQQR